MPKAFLMKKKSGLAVQGRPISPKLYSPTSSGIASPNGSTASSNIESSPRRNDENHIENCFVNKNVSKHSFEKIETQGLDLSVKSLLKESNSFDRISDSKNSKHFVSSYPYPAKFAKISGFLRGGEENKTSNASFPVQIKNPEFVFSKTFPDNSSKNRNVSTLTTDNNNSSPNQLLGNPINYSATSTSDGDNNSSVTQNYQRVSPYSINWSEHFSVNKIIVSPTASSHGSDDSGRGSFHSEMDHNEKCSDSGFTAIKNENKKSDRYQCPDCNKSYSTHSGLAKHQEFLCASQMKKSFSCKHCDKVYVSLGALKMHIRTHTLPCKCKLCGKAFSRPWLLQGHIRTHTGEKPFACQFCNRAFADRSNLRAHLQTHSVVKKYNCKTCSRTFSRMSLLLKHEDNGCNGTARISPIGSSFNPKAEMIQV